MFLVAAAIVALAMIACGALLARTRDLATALVIGYPVFGTLCFLVGLIAINKITMALITIPLALAGVYVATGFSPSKGGLKPAPTFILAVLAILAIISALEPPIHLDEVVYHLAVPWEWVKEGHPVELPLNSQSYFPLGTESADLPLLTFLGSMQGGIASHFVHLFAAIATVALALRIGDAFITVAVISTPALAMTAGWSQADWPLLGICLVLFDQDERKQMSAIAAGLLTKYTFLPFVAISAFVSRKWKPVVLGVAIGSVFLIRNLVLTGDPIAPFLMPDSPHVAAFRQSSLIGYVFDPEWLDEALGVPLLSLPFLASGTFAILAGLCGLAILLALAPSSRILVPFFAVPALTARVSSRVLRSILAVGIVIQVGIVALFVISEVRGPRTRASFAATKWIDAQLPRDARVLVIGVNETYWFDHVVRGAGNFDSARMSRYVVNGIDPNITHIAIMAQRRRNDISKAAEREMKLTPEANAALMKILARATLVGTREDARLYQLAKP